MQPPEKEQPFWARVIISEAWGGAPDHARRLLDALTGQWPRGISSRVLLLCGGFVECPWPREAMRQLGMNGLRGAGASLEVLGSAADQALSMVLSPTVRAKLRHHTHAVALGIDTHSALDSYSAPHAEFAYLVDLRTQAVWRAAKSYPAGLQERGLLRNPDPASHFVEFDGRRVMLLQCHDLAMFHPRGNARAKGWRAKQIALFRKAVRERRPEIAIHCPHTADTPRTWSASWHRLLRVAPSIEYYAASGRFYNDGHRCRGSLDDVLDSTVSGAAINFVLRKFRQPGTPL